MFSFLSGTTLRRFTTTTTRNQKSLIRNLRLKMEWSPREIMLWNSLLKNESVENWSELRSVRLHVIHERDEIDWRHLQDKQHYIQNIGDYCKSLRKLSHLPLTSAEVVIRGRVWSQKERDQFTGDLQRMFMSHSGTDTYTAAQCKVPKRDTPEIEKENLSAAP
ncbi:MAG: hypothetical protein Q9213_006904 [Squamulea squamosa]